MTGCAPLKASLPAPTPEQVQTVATIPPAVSTSVQSMNASTQIPPTPTFPWKMYHSDIYGFSFAYPAIYDEQQYQVCSLKVVEQPDSTEFSLGRQSFLNVQRKGDLDLQTYVDDLVAQKQAEGSWTLDSQNIRMVNGKETIEVNYRFGGTNRFGTATFLTQKDLLLTFNFSAGAFCDVTEINVTEGQAYAQWIDSLRFDK